MELKINTVDNQRHAFSRVKARWAAPNVPDDLDEREQWLAEWLNQCLSEYEKGLEQLCQSMQDQLFGAINLRLPEPVVIKREP